MSEASNLDFTIDPKDQELKYETITPAQWDALAPEKDSKSEEKKPVSRAAAVKSIGASIGAIHWIGAKVLDEPALELDKDEKKAYGETGVDLCKAYGLDLATHPKAAAWLNFGTTALEIDGPRVVLVLTKPPKKRHIEAEDGDVPPLVFPEITQ